MLEFKCIDYILSTIVRNTIHFTSDLPVRNLRLHDADILCNSCFTFIDFDGRSRELVPGMNGTGGMFFFGRRLGRLGP